jgi:hypothetical protein
VAARTAVHGQSVRLCQPERTAENRITVEPSLRYYTESDANGNHLTRLTPALRATYRVLNHLSLESQVLYERSKTDGPTQNDTTSNVFYYIGYRYDFQ